MMAEIAQENGAMTLFVENLPCSGSQLNAGHHGDVLTSSPNTLPA
jgi:hypothetical protein